MGYQTLKQIWNEHVRQPRNDIRTNNYIHKNKSKEAYINRNVR